MRRRASLIRSSVTVYEVAFVLQESERAVRGRLRRGELSDVGAGRGVRIDAGELGALIFGRPLQEQVLEALLSHRAIVPRPASRGVPPELHVVLDELRGLA